MYQENSTTTSIELMAENGDARTLLREPRTVLAPSAPTIAIIGAGFSGTLTAVQVVRHAAHPLRVLLYNPKEHFGPGLAYGTPSGEHLLNVPAGGMSALDDDPGHFLTGSHHAAWRRAPTPLSNGMSTANT